MDKTEMEKEKDDGSLSFLKIPEQDGNAISSHNIIKNKVYEINTKQ